MNARLRVLLGVIILLLSTALSCADAEPARPQLSRTEALRYYVQWICDDPLARSVQLVEAEDTLRAEFDDGTWHFSYRGGWYVFYRGAVINASMQEQTRVVVADSPTDEAQAASRCRSLTG